MQIKRHIDGVRVSVSVFVCTQVLITKLTKNNCNNVNRNDTKFDTAQHTLRSNIHNTRWPLVVRGHAGYFINMHD